jgi:hypothetical protein
MACSGEGVACLICGTLCLPSPGLWKFGQAGCLQADSSDWRHLCGLPRKINQFPKAAKTWSLQRELEPLFLYQEQMRATVLYVEQNLELRSVRDNFLSARLVKHTEREENWIHFIVVSWNRLGCYWAQSFRPRKLLATAKTDWGLIFGRDRNSFHQH